MYPPDACPSPSPEDAAAPDLVSPLRIDSTLQALPLHQIYLPLEATGKVAAQYFEQTPTLPGILLTAHGKRVGILSRARFLEYLLRPHGASLFLTEPLSVLYGYARLAPLVLPDHTPILTAAQAALRRPLECQTEPLLVTGSAGDRLLCAQELNLAHWQIRGIETQIRYERIQAQMLQHQKMAALGRLVDGVAHEILDPLGFIWGNLAHVSRYCQDLLELVNSYEAALHTAAIAPPALMAQKATLELDYLRDDLPATLASIQNGANRLKQLAISLQNFCHIDDVYPKAADLHDLLDSIVLLLKSRLTHRIEIQRHYTPLPPVLCFAGQLSQVFMNVLSHCTDTLLTQAFSPLLAEAYPMPEGTTAIASRPHITITTRLIDAPTGSPASRQRWVVITIADNGPSLSATAEAEINASFSIAQRLAKETDLATSYRIITAKHGGTFVVKSRTRSSSKSPPQTGTEFEIRLPLYSLALDEH
jgi:signal transduction histidine kinase